MKTAILGIGLIGGSLGLGLRQASWPVQGWSPSPDTRALALRRGAIERAFETPEDAVEDAELIVVASPIRAIPEIFQAIAGAARDGAVVTDVASVKAQVLRWAAELLPPRLRFVGGHPMAGKEVQGVAAADPATLHGCTYCLAPPDAEALPVVREMVEAIHARPLILNAEEHDRAVAAASHLPFVAATALVQAATPELGGLAGEVAASGFRDTTRVAMASPPMHADICNFNAEAVRDMIDRMQRELDALKASLTDPAIEASFVQAAEARRQWAISRGGL